MTDAPLAPSTVPTRSGPAGRPYLITGGAGFIGSNLADALLRRGDRVILYDNLSRAGGRTNVEWLKERHGAAVELIEADVPDRAQLTEAVDGVEAVVHFAAQVAVTASLQDPLHDFSVNAAGTLTLLEALRGCGRPVPVILASTNKVYGDLSRLALSRETDGWLPTDPLLRARGLDESWPLDLCTPYGCSKGAADQYVLDHARSFGRPAIVVRMSCVYGPRQFGTEDQGWVAHFAVSALRGDPVTIFGDGRQVRDIVHVSDAVRAYSALLDAASRLTGRTFNLGGGPANAVTLNTVISEIERITERPLARRFEPMRTGDQLYYVAATHRLAEAIGWTPAVGWREGLVGLVDWIAGHRRLIGLDAEPRRQWSLSA